MKVLVTGGAGFIGSHIVEALHQKADVVVLDSLRSGHLSNLAGLRHRFIKGDIMDRAAVARAMEGVDYVFHLAAMISVPESVLDPAGCVDINVKGTLVVLEEAAKAKAKKLVFSSSAAIYGDDPTVPKLEDMLPRPKSPYAVSKLDGEYYCQQFSDSGKLQTACLRYFNVYGERQDPKSQYAAAVPIFISRALANKEITIFGDGGQTRDFVSVKDIAAANIYAATHDHVKGVFNVGYNNAQTILDLASSIIKQTGSTSIIKHAPERLGDVRHSRASVDKLLATGWKPSSTFEQGLDRTVAYFRGVHKQQAKL